MTKRPIRQGDISVLTVYVPNTIASNYMKQNLLDLKGKRKTSNFC